ncbi:MAG TPA: DUF6036 family nucleotidyltransferase [Acidobacteriota bacterium]|jgi:hypothetical protein|nr:DUF6036 family nucleotidyltransferase [Acidobacteriota bacterium]
MRQVADRDRIWTFMRAVGAEAKQQTRFYFTGGATAVLLDWRPSTIDVDVMFIPESDEIFRSIPRLKESLKINVELASPADFIPELPGWQERSVFVTQEGKVAFFHYDLYAQALAKIERSHSQDIGDVQEMISRGLVERSRVWSLFTTIEPQLYRYPSLDPRAFRSAVENIVGSQNS